MQGLQSRTFLTFPAPALKEGVGVGLGAGAVLTKGYGSPHKKNRLRQP